MRISLLRCAAMLAALLPAVSHAASDPGSIGLGLDKLHMHMTVAESRRAYPALIDRGGNSGQLTLEAYQLEGCEFTVNLWFNKDALGMVELGTQEPADHPLKIDICKVPIMKRLIEQYGPGQPPPDPYFLTAYYRQNDVMTITARQEYGHACGLAHDTDRHVYISFYAGKDSPVIICG